MQPAPTSLLGVTRPTRTWLFAALFGVWACGGTPDGVTISGDVEGLDTIALRGDSLFAQADRLPTTIDSLRAVAEGRVPPRIPKSGKSATSDRPTASAPGVAPLTPRAQARGDSLAKATARRLAASNSGERSSGDTVRGIVTLIGSDQSRQVVLKTVDGSRIITMSGMVTTGMHRLAGLELRIRGVMITPRDVVVSDYLVRAVDGVPAYDGKLTSGSDGSYLQLTDGTGRKRLASVPAPLQGLEGSRVWIAIKPGVRAGNSYGVIGRR